MTEPCEKLPLTVHQVRTWAAIEACGSDTSSVLASAAFTRCADEIERLQAQVADLEKLVMNVAMRCVRDPDAAAEMMADERWLIGS